MLSNKNSIQAKKSTHGGGPNFTEVSVRSNKQFIVVPHKERHSSEETKAALVLLNKKIDNIESFLANTLRPDMVYQKVVEMES